MLFSSFIKPSCGFPLMGCIRIHKDKNFVNNASFDGVSHFGFKGEVVSMQDV